MMRASPGATAALVLTLCVAACGGGVDGGPGKADEASPGPSQVASSEAGAVAEDVDAGRGATWTDLYRDLFGPGAPASCASNGGCHGAASESGALGSHGYVCASQHECRASMLALETGLVQTSDFTAPETSTLFQVLRHRTSSGSLRGTMPKRSTYLFSEDSLARLEVWLRNGAPDD